ncbi:MAG: c-type cytochrome biogenesis protein CcsB, partial [Dehalococcoidia bacterium]
MTQLESFSYSLFWAGLVGVALASLLYAGAVWGWRVVVRQAATSAGTVTLTERQPLPPAVGTAATATTRLSLALLLGYALTRVIATGRPPYSDMFEYLAAFGTLTVGFYVVFERRYRQRTLGVVAMPLALLLLVLAQTLFTPKVEPLVPALKNNRLLAIHVASMLISYSALTVAFAATVLYLVQGEGNRYPRLPSAHQLETLSYRAVLVGFPILALGIALGAYWGNIAWGRYWGWDPKETTALITWLIFAGYMHARHLAGWRGKRAAAIVCLGFAMILFNIFAVNFWIA